MVCAPCVSRIAAVEGRAFRRAGEVITIEEMRTPQQVLQSAVYAHNGNKKGLICNHCELAG